MGHKVLFEVTSDKEIRFAVVFNGRLFTFLLKQIEQNWVFLSFDKELKENKELVKRIFRILLRKKDVKTKLEDLQIEPEKILFEEYYPEYGIKKQ
ncbi:hypothetical protein [Pseudalkalibacillus caeni]|uniref:Uncharacterized protein n=1 Tax=Exobacillus caeni TaxID=2574798 RepID=A0A5R9F918_9BACL|nr:hypothetical protein [Pseudalkalibacillus caeni]TLS37034.1 hypothetical protein FCL54_10905 [Pseudalkalibacillus caeni]